MNWISNVIRLGIAAPALYWSICVSAQTQHHPDSLPTVTVDREGLLHIPSYTLPLSIYMSEGARAFYKSLNSATSSASSLPWPSSPEMVESAYPVIIEEKRIAGVKIDVVTPKEGVARQNRNRVLINLHAGGFYCYPAGQLIESAPIASLARIKVISVDYRCAPEYKFPAASEDVTAVYKELLKQFKPQNIGIYGGASGATLTAESVAWFQKERLPRPGAIGLISGADGVWGGDSRYIAPQIGTEIPPPAPNPPPAEQYFSEVDVTDPLVSPTLHLELLGTFPPTLLIAGTRDYLLSSVVYAHTQLVKAGVYAELRVWEGMPHCFYYFDMPESKEMYEVLAKFFNQHLGN